MKKHPWKKASTYLILIGVCVGILLLVLLGITILDKMNKGEYINDNIAQGIVFFICIPGILVGIIGAIICAVRKK
jgi:hypothetical protein